ncbi:MAG: RNA-binding S4 domain-containing protein [Clostridia bacterium]|nr:RNA-binding S4 domain-containing protein [Clostridia bacterium]
MRIDKFLKVSRLLKRRTVAGEAAKGGRVKINGKAVKPAHEVKVGDIVELGFQSGTIAFRVLAVKETVKKEETSSLYEIISE